MKINSKFIRFDSNYRVESNFSDAGFVQNSFNSIRESMIRLIRKVKNNSKNSIKINSKFVRFDSTPPLFWDCRIKESGKTWCLSYGMFALMVMEIKIAKNNNELPLIFTTC